MSGIEQAGLIILAIIVVMVLASRGARQDDANRIEDADRETWWWARRSWRDGGR
ncbi:hypothetical protein GGQ89_003687 [Sphingomonas yabuuchiae]|jgi:hypothetical protein|uniref:Uncharacterized protein n=1 Tax=Sphingomonas yabuuchiae TaxID=172044 RepID=A0ABR6KFW0_9SPHN|nr:hypothetical protein [Sphingomonas yabuuchiae]